ncbi:hypothetical protein Tco_0821141 [Tanacetum coccineum]|uniref:Uncharacterized protein n=1 Tax=Tanacetum coccineum TaxID=301880 RepID=A0ABQ5AE23_9ASTR
MTTPRAHKRPTLTSASPQGKKSKQSAEETSLSGKSLKVTIRQRKQSTTLIPPPSDDSERDEISKATLLKEEEMDKMVKGEDDEESYASEFADSIFNDDDDFGTRIEPRSHKKNPEVIDDDDVTVIEKKGDKKVNDEKKDDDVEKKDDGAEDKKNDDQTDQTLVRIHTSGSMETRTEKMKTPIPTPPRSPRKDLSSYKIISKELTSTVSPTNTTTSKPKSKRGFTSNKTKILPRSIAGINR